jgi:pyruvate-formate lyase-activating enzyme
MYDYWPKGIVSWSVGKVQYLSVVFTWDLPEAKAVAEASKKKVVAGGPAVALMDGYLAGVAKIGEDLPYPVLPFHNPAAVFTSRGCPNACEFCAVPRTEGPFRELAAWEPKPLVCDNNILASSKRHFGKVIDSLKPLPFVDFNQGLDARLFRPRHASRLAELKAVKVRFAFDHRAGETVLVDAVRLARSRGLKDISVYVLVGYKDTPADARARLELVKSLGIRPWPMRYRPLDCLHKNEHVPEGWEKKELQDLVAYNSRLQYMEHIPYERYRQLRHGRNLTIRQGDFVWADEAGRLKSTSIALGETE